MFELVEHTASINKQLARYGVRFGIYKNNEFHEQLFPFDAIPRVIPADEFDFLEKGLIQRVNALNAFLADIYSEKKFCRTGLFQRILFTARRAICPNVRALFRRAAFSATFPALIWCRQRTASGTFWRIICAFRPALLIR